MKVNCEFREFAKSDRMPVYTIVGEVLLDNLDQLLGTGGRGWDFMFGICPNSCLQALSQLVFTPHNSNVTFLYTGTQSIGNLHKQEQGRALGVPLLAVLRLGPPGFRRINL